MQMIFQQQLRRLYFYDFKSSAWTRTARAHN